MPSATQWSLVARLLAGAAAVGLVLVALAPASATGSVTSNRLGGSDRYGTAGQVAQAKFGSGPVGTAVLADGLNFPDALAGSFLAGGGSAAILLTDPNAVPPNLSQALVALGVRDVVILGGTTAVSAAVQDSLVSSGYAVSRIGGLTRYDTMQAIDTSPTAPAVGTIGGKKTAIVATGTHFPDALAAGAAAYKAHLPIVLTDPTSLSPQAQDTLSALGIQQVLIMGGSAAISPAVNTQITAMGITVLAQFAGANRNDTAAQLAADEVANLGFSDAEVVLTRGDDFADALSGAQYAGDPKPILLTADPGNLSNQTAAALVANCSGIHKLTALGGRAAISDGVLAEAVQAAECQDVSSTTTPGATSTTSATSTSTSTSTSSSTSTSTTTTTTAPSASPSSASSPSGAGGLSTAAPDLVSASVAGSTVRVTYDKAIAPSSISSGYGGLRFLGPSTSTAASLGTCQPDSNPDVEDCAIPSGVNPASYTLLVVDSHTVTGATPAALPNPLGSVSLSGGAESAQGPILLSASGSNNAGTVTFAFSEAINDASGFQPTYGAFFVLDPSGKAAQGQSIVSVSGSSVTVAFGGQNIGMAGAGVTSQWGHQIGVGSGTIYDSNDNQNVPGSIAASSS